MTFRHAVAASFRLVALAVLLFGPLLTGCGYRLAGKSSALPDHVRRIAVPVFENRTQQPDIAERLTENVVDEFIARGGLVATSSPEGADAVLQGTVTGYRTVAVVIGNDGLARRYEIELRLQAELVDTASEDVLWKDDHFLFRAQYDVEADASLSAPSTGDGFFDQSIVGIERVSLEAARSIVATILEGF